MARLVMSCGPMLWPMLLLTVIVAVMSGSCVIRLLWGHSGPRVRSSINAILFWGLVTAVLGFMGQWMGLYKATQVIFEHAPRMGISPRAVGIGFAESLRTSILGVAVLLASVVSWFVLDAWRERLAAHRPPHDSCQ